MSPVLTTPFRSRRTLIAGGVAVGAIVIGGIAALALSSPQPAPVIAAAKATPTPSASRTPGASPTPTEAATPLATPAPEARCPLDGLPLTDDAELPAVAMAVQIENHPDARPTRNLGNADMVVEATVEGDMTRFTGIFLCDQTDGMTGPVRSARYYNIDLWQDFHVLTVAFGRSNGAYERFVRAGMPFANGMDGGWPWFRRYGPRAAPHNLYLDLAGMTDGLEADSSLQRLAEATGDLRPPFTFSTDAPLPDDGRPVADLSISTVSWWHFGWTWDADRDSWLRTDAGRANVDEDTDEQLSATSVIVQRVTEETVYGDPDPAGAPRKLQHLVGSGEGTAYIGGRAYDLHWERSTADDGTTWTFAESGDPVVLPPGQVWLEILPRQATLAENK